MNPGWRAFALPTALAVVLAAGPVPSGRAGGEGGKAKSVQEQLQHLDASLKRAFDKVGEEIKSVRQDFQSAKEERAAVQQKLEDALTRITALDRVVADMKREVEALRKPAPRVAAAPDPTTLADIQGRLARIEQMLDRPLVPGRVSLYPPAAGESTDGRREKTREVRAELEQLDAAARRGFDLLRDDLAALRREVKDCRDDRTLAQLKLQTALASLGSLQPQLAEMRGELEALRARVPATVSLYPPAERTAIDEICAKVDRVEQTLRRPPAPSHVARYPAAQAGRVVLVNTSPEELTFVVDGRSYPVAPGGTMALDGQPAGPFSYEVISPTWGVRDRRTTALGANETLTLTAR
jgi:chromosome segregation ATPase